MLNKNKYLLIIILFLFTSLSSKAACPCSRYNTFSLLYNYFAPQKIRAKTNPYYYAAGALIYPKSIILPGSPLVKHLPGTQYTAGALYFGPQLINKTKNAYVSGFNTPSTTKQNTYYIQNENQNTEQLNNAYDINYNTQPVLNY